MRADLACCKVGSYSFVFPSVPGDESWPALRGRPVRFLVPLLDLLNHALDPNVAIQRSSGGGARAFTARALRHIRCDALCAERHIGTSCLAPLHMCAFACAVGLEKGVQEHEAEARLRGGLHHAISFSGRVCNGTRCTRSWCTLAGVRCFVAFTVPASLDGLVLLSQTVSLPPINPSP